MSPSSTPEPPASRSRHPRHAFSCVAGASADNWGATVSRRRFAGPSGRSSRKTRDRPDNRPTPHAHPTFQVVTGGALDRRSPDTRDAGAARKSIALARYAGRKWPVTNSSVHRVAHRTSIPDLADAADPPARAVRDGQAGRERNPMSHTAHRELAYRSQNGLEVTLLRDPGSNEVSVEVIDQLEDSGFRLPIAGHLALDAFHHPYAYAQSHADHATDSRRRSRRSDWHGDPRSRRQTPPRKPVARPL